MRAIPTTLARFALCSALLLAVAPARADDPAPARSSDPAPAGTDDPAPARALDPAPARSAAPAPVSAAAVVPPETAPAPGPAARPLGLWVLAEGSQRVLENPDRLPALLADAQALGVSDLFVQVYRRGLAWWPSELAGQAESDREARARRGPDAPDPIAQLLAAAHAAGLRVHAWVNVLSLADNPDAAIVAALGPGILQTDRKGRSILEYPELEMPAPEAPHLRMGTPAVWIDPAAPGVAAWYGLLAAELFRRYPGLDGLHLDYIRYPDVLPFAPGSRFGVGMDFGYGEATRRRFQEATGKQAPFGDALAHAKPRRPALLSHRLASHGEANGAHRPPEANLRTAEAVLVVWHGDEPAQRRVELHDVRKLCLPSRILRVVLI